MSETEIVDCSEFWDIMEGNWAPPTKEDVEAYKKEFNVCRICGDLAFHSEFKKYFCGYHWKKLKGGIRDG